ncbi:MAG: formyltetrahydrofolate deformylase [Spirochaetales bacterium]|nr:formyltetrahydrofolate deformylase [Spirochaetales bacterium]
MKKRETAILLLSCEDVKGIVAEISHFISTYDGNILYSNQHQDVHTNTFFMRIEWDLAKFQIPIDKIRSAFEPIATKFKMNWQIHFSTEKAKIAIFVSKLDHCLLELLWRHKEGEIDAEIVQIVSNHEDSRPMAEFFGVPFTVIKKSQANKQEAEAREFEVLENCGADLIVLARYMQILSPEFVKKYRNQIINIHHSFLPAFVGAKPYHQAFEKGVKLIGTTSHYVTEDLDQGPIIAQDVVNITHKDSIEDLVLKGKNLEKIVLSKAVQLHLEHKLHVHKNKTIVFE